MSKLKNIGRNVITLGIGVLVALVLCEGILHVYNPLPSRVRGDQIQLPANLKRTIEITPAIEGLDPVINYSVNSIGMRGPEPPENFDEQYTIFTVGGSTTECSLLDDAKTWPARLGEKLSASSSSVWLNNAGIDGCSTYGHLILVEDHLVQFKPDMIAFLIGVNDRGKATFESETGFLIQQDEGWLRGLAKKSELITLCTNLWRSYQAKKVHLGHGKAVTNTDEPTGDGIPAWQKTTPEERAEKLALHTGYLPQYRERVRALIDLCQQHNIVPAIITQPLMDHEKSVSWEVMALYNTVALEEAAKAGVPGFDLGTQLEKEPGYYYDSMHFTNEGAERVAELLHQALTPFVAGQ